MGLQHMGPPLELFYLFPFVLVCSVQCVVYSVGGLSQHLILSDLASSYSRRSSWADWAEENLMIRPCLFELSVEMTHGQC